MTVREVLQVACCNVTIINSSNHITVDATNSYIIYYLNDAILNATVRVIRPDANLINSGILVRTSL